MNESKITGLQSCQGQVRKADLIIRECYGSSRNNYWRVFDWSVYYWCYSAV